MREIQATEAKTHLAQLLSAVERGESFAITRHGRPIAHLVPAAAGTRAAARDAVARFRTRRARWGRTGVSLDDILAARHEGHRA
jgi:prevent-host-death family protein